MIKGGPTDLPNLQLLFRRMSTKIWVTANSLSVKKELKNDNFIHRRKAGRMDGKKSAKRDETTSRFISVAPLLANAGWLAMSAQPRKHGAAKKRRRIQQHCLNSTHMKPGSFHIKPCHVIARHHAKFHAYYQKPGKEAVTDVLIYCAYYFVSQQFKA